jgi:two-component system phosphate regulon sensor histidine kinase PhoR
MSRTPDAPLQTGPADLGFGRSHVVLGLCASAAVPAGSAIATGGDAVHAAIAAAAGIATATGLGFLANRVLRRAVARPLQSLARAMEQLRGTREAIRLSESGAPLLQPIVRLFNQTANSVQEREQLSQANLMSVEVAFDRVHSVLQSLHEGVIVVDVQGRVVLANAAARRTVQPDGNSIDGKPLAQVLDGDLAAAVRTAIARLDDTGAEETQVSDITRGGRIYDLTVVQVRATRPDHDFGKVVVLIDVTRNHEINQLKDDLLSSISHELRTPLTNMCSSSEILAQMAPPEDSDLREFAHILNLESHRLKALVDDVLQYNQLETGRLQLHLERTDMAVLARNALQLLQPRLQQHRLQLGIEGAETAMIHADPRRATEVLFRVLDNAINFTPAGGSIRIDIDSHDGLVEVTVGDSGPGIPAEDRQRVFERFTQLGNLMTEKPKGAGLGLSICQRLVDAMGGTIWCDDSPLGGASLHFVLPQQQPAPIAE